jgi:hypothetical protein
LAVRFAHYDGRPGAKRSDVSGRLTR